MQYFQRIKQLIELVEVQEADHVDQLSTLLVDTILNKRNIYIFGASHAGIIAEEMFYRAGGLMTITPIFGQELMLSNQPIMTTSRMERLEGYGTVLAQKVGFHIGDVLIVHSVSGRNPVAIDMALAAREAGATVAGLVNLTYSQSVTSKHSSGKRLFELCHLLLDNHGEAGDAMCSIDGMEQKVGPSSTVIGAILMNTVVVQAVEKLKAAGVEHPPIFYSANRDGGDEKNRELFEIYRDCIGYQL